MFDYQIFIKYSVRLAKFTNCQNQSARYAFVIMYVSAPPLALSGYKQG